MKEAKAKKERITELIKSALNSMVKGPYYGNRSVARDDRKDDWRAGATKPTLAARTAVRHRRNKMAKRARRITRANR